MMVTKSRNYLVECWSGSLGAEESTAPADSGILGLVSKHIVPLFLQWSRPPVTNCGKNGPRIPGSDMMRGQQQTGSQHSVIAVSRNESSALTPNPLDP
jgi:hypothetical protein